MVDCGNPRCAVDRRSFRRDIQTLSKKLSVILGLERIAADYVDEDTAKLLLNPYPAWEKELVQDFEPPKKCFHCDKKLANVYKLIQKVTDDARNGKECNGKICLKSLQDLIPFCVDFYTCGFGQELFSESVKAYFLTGIQQQTEVKENQESSSSTSSGNESQATLIIPCPLTGRSVKKQEIIKQTHTEESLDHVILDVDSVEMSIKRAAIQGLPTKGLPTTTLHGKMVKREQEDAVTLNGIDETPYVIEQELQNPATSHRVPDIDMSDADVFGVFETVLNRRMPPFIPPRSFQMGVEVEPDDHAFSLEQRLDKIRRLHNLNGLNEIRPRPAHSNHLKLPLLANVVRKLVHQRFMEIKCYFRFKINSHKMKLKHEPFIPNSPYPQKFHPYASNFNDENLSTTICKQIMEGIYANMFKKEGYIPKSFGRVNECSRIGDTLKDIIAKSISEKIRLMDVSSDKGSETSIPDTSKVILETSEDRCTVNFCPEMSHANAESKISSRICSLPKHPKKNNGKPHAQSARSNTHSNTSLMKKTRPKRGQYRKYNSQLLMDAVKAVQRGEMSVHRAGSYFGVPHSTLEYKVKERHLLRQKKLREVQPQPPVFKSTVTKIQTTGRASSLTPEDDILSASKKHSGSSSARSSISSASSTSSPPLASSFNISTPPSFAPQSLILSSFSASHVPSSALPVPSSKDLSNLTWFQPLLTSKSANHNSAPEFPSELTLNNSASELLIKLQHKVQTKGSPFSDGSAFGLPHIKGQAFDIGHASNTGISVSDQLALYNESI